MSRNHHIHAHEVSRVINDINRLGHEEAERLYGIEFRNEGRVYDPTYDREFISVGEWAEFSFSDDETEYSEDIRSSKYSDEY